MDIRAATPAQAPLFTEWALREGWGAGVDDIGAFFSADPGGFLLAVDSDQAVGSISAVFYDPGYAFVGYYIVDSQLRGRGIGHALFDAALARIGAAASGLDGVLEQVETYSTLGYRVAHETPRYVGSSSIISAALAGDAAMTAPVTPADIDELIDYDAACVPARRETFVRAWLDHSPTRRSYVVRSPSGEIGGYATVRSMIGGGSRIGPLFADDEAAARALLAACAITAMSWGDQLAIDVPSAHLAGIDLVESLGMTTTFRCVRMYRGEVRTLPMHRIWGNTSFELG